MREAVQFIHSELRSLLVVGVLMSGVILRRAL